MKKIVVIAILFFTACSPKVDPIKGSYLTGPYQIKSTESQAEVWDNMIDLFAQKGLSIKIIDRSSGLITSEKSKLTWSRESQKKPGTLVTPNAFVVIERITFAGSKNSYVNPSYVTGEWNIRIKPNADSTTNINVNLVNIQAFAYYSDLYLASSKTLNEVKIDAKSTGNFEKLIADAVK